VLFYLLQNGYRSFISVGKFPGQVLAEVVSAGREFDFSVHGTE
jgi:hypothetical protein